MKTSSYTVLQWTSSEPDLDIAWPCVHDALGHDCVQWLNRQSLDRCQLIVEQQGQDHRLVLEFYSPVAEREFHLLRS